MTLCAAVVQLAALEAGTVVGATGRAVHGLWFRHWQQAAPAVAETLHAPAAVQPFTLSPLLGLPRPQDGQVALAPGAPAWFRVTTLTAELSDRLAAAWLPTLPAELTLGGLRWRVTGITTDGTVHPWAGQAEPSALAEQRLLAADPPRRWRLRFATPTAFHGESGHLPFPLPAVLVSSWLRRWERYGPVGLPADLPERARRGLAISAYALRTVPVRERERVTIGCVGHLTLQAIRLKAGERAPLDLLAAFAFWAGSGHHTTQGLGLTKGVEIGEGSRE